MIPTPFRKPSRAPQRGFFAKLFHRPEPSKALSALRGLLADKAPATLPKASVARTLAEFEVGGPESRRLLAQLWSDALAQFLTDGILSADEQSYLAELATYLGLSETEILGPRNATGSSAYKSAIDRVFRDGQVSEEEWQKLEALKNALSLPDSVHAAIYGPAAKRVFEKSLTEATKDHRLSPIDREHLDALAKALHVSINYDGDIQQQLNRYSLYWRIENGDIPTISVPLSLQKNEVAYWQGAVEWLEIRRRTTRIGYSGPTVSIPIVKGVRWRMGSFTPSRITKDELTRIDSGSLYVTNKRLIFAGALKNTAIKYSSLIGFQLFQDGIVLDKASGKSPHLRLQDDPELLAVILGSALAMSTGT